jgi:hypothetical protein
VKSMRTFTPFLSLNRALKRDVGKCFDRYQTPSHLMEP